jgi:RNA polymerase sigma factor (sigma-70 family)
VKSSSSLPLSSFVGVAADAPASVTMAADPERSDGGDSFSALYRATLAPLRRYLARMLGNSPEAEDVAHDAYLRVYPTLQKQAAEKPEALLYVTARRLAINRLKRRSISPLSPEGASLETAAAPARGVAEQVMARQELRLLQEAIAELPEGCRTVLLLRKVELLSHREIADRLGIAISTVEKQHARALRLLKAALPSDCAVPESGSAKQEVSS